MTSATVVAMIVGTDGPVEAADGSTSERASGQAVVRTLDYVSGPDGKSLRPVAEPVGDAGVFDHYKVTFGIDRSDVIRSREVELVRGKPEKTGEGRTKLATFKSNDQGRVKLEWWAPSRVGQWTISRDGEVIATVTDSTYVDYRPDVGSETVYIITGERTAEIDGGATTVEPYTTVIEVPAVDASLIGLAADSAAVGELNTDVLSVAAAGDWQMVQQLNTFIPTARADTPFNIQPCVEAYGGSGVGYYGGDNRGFAGPYATKPSSRTAIQTSTWHNLAGWTTGSSRTSYWTSGTTLYDGDGDLLASANADLSGIKNVGGAGDFMGGYGTYTHHVADPLCSVAPAIDYELTFGGFGNGHVLLYGSHDQAPSYEWRVKTYDTFMNLYTFESRGLAYLLPVYPQAHVDYVGSVGVPH